jgi:hypothetical protein
MTEYVTSHDAKFDAQGRLYIPQCMRDMLSVVGNIMYASVHQHPVGPHVVLQTTPAMSVPSKEVKISKDGYVCIARFYKKAQMAPPFRWQATAKMPTGSIDALILWQDKDLEIPPEKNKEFAGVLRGALYGKKKTI